jgi:hypothetical protein
MEADDDTTKPNATLILNTTGQLSDTSITPNQWYINNYFKANNYHNYHVFYNFNNIFKNAVGDLYDKYNYFKINLYMLTSNKITISVNNANDICYSIVVAGLDFINQNNNTLNVSYVSGDTSWQVNNDSWTIANIEMNLSTNLANSYIETYDENNFAIIKKPTSNTNLIIYYYKSGNMKTNFNLSSSFINIQYNINNFHFKITPIE